MYFRLSVHLLLISSFNINKYQVELVVNLRSSKMFISNPLLGTICFDNILFLKALLEMKINLISQGVQRRPI